MRIDHQAYQRATRVAGVGFLVQVAIGLTLLVFSLVGGETALQDTAFLFGSLYVLLGLLAWLGLIVIFNQHKLERLEALEEDEIAAGRDRTRATGSVFSGTDEEIHVAARRLRLMHKWLIPAVSLLIAVGLGLMAWWMLRHMGLIARGEAEFQLTPHIGWAVAICLAFSALSFIVSRFVAGMAKQAAWQNLRGGAAYMVGNSLVTLAIAVGIGFRFFRNDEVVRGIAYAIPIFMLVVAAEIILNFVLNLYRPRIPGETPRPAFDSKLLSLFAAPDNLVRSINEAINYQFGFDITSSWGYQLLLRSCAWLLAIGAAVLLALNMVVIVEPHQQAVKLIRGEIAGDRVYTSGVMMKLPWPFQSAQVFDVSRVRELSLTGRQIVAPVVQLWTDDLGRKFDRELQPFIVGRSTLRPEDLAGGGLGAGSIGATAESGGDAAGGGAGASRGPDRSDRISESFSLVDAEIVVQYRIREANGGLLDYLGFASDDFSRRFSATVREEAMRVIALREIGQALSVLSIDDLLAGRRNELPEMLRDRVQDAFDANGAGVEVTAVNLPLLRPAGSAAAGFEELSVSHQARQEHIENARQRVVAGLAELIGDADRLDAILAGVEEYQRRRDEMGTDADETLVQRAEVERMLIAAGGAAAQAIAQAERDRWVQLMQTRAEANRVRGQTVSYRAAPRIYRERETMAVYARSLPELYKYILCVDPARVDLDIDLNELNAMFGIGDAFEEDELGQSQ